MKRRIAACLLAAVFWSCGGETPPAGESGVATARGIDEVDQLRTENQDLKERNAYLETMNGQQSAMLAQYTEKLNQILDSLDAINGRQAEIDRMVTRTAEGGFVSTRYDVDARIRSNLAEIDRRLRESRTHQDEIRHIASRSGGRATGITASVERLSRLLESKEQEIRELRLRVSELEYTSAELRREVARKDTQLQESEKRAGRLESELREAYYVIGTRGELRSLAQEGVLQRQRSGLLGSFYHAGSGSHRHRFRRMDPTADRLRIGTRLRGAEIVSLHANSQRLYRLEKEGDDTVLVLTDPLQFWDISKFLVIEVER